MMPAVFALELIALYLFSQWLTQSLFTFFLLLFRARSVAITCILLLQFPGTVVHELAHLFTASILGVPAGKLTLVPENIREDEIKSGGVSIAASDPFRRYAIGLAPVFAGIMIITAIAYFLPQLIPHQGNWGNLGDWGVRAIVFYLLFSVSNAMFSSKEDLKGFIPFSIVLGLFIAAGYFVGLRIDLTGQALTIATQILTTLVKSLSVVLGVNGIILLLTSLFTRLIQKLA
jgi:hypothetical protein